MYTQGVVREVAFDEVFDSQAIFRVLLDALSRPGKVIQLPGIAWTGSPPGFPAAALSVLKTLCDHRVSFSLGRPNERRAWISYLEVNLSTPFRRPEEADFVLFDGAGFDEEFAYLKRGTPEFPERSATALLCIGALADFQAAPVETVRTLSLEGPGVEGRAALAVSGLDGRYVDERARANRFAPMGIDLILVDEAGRVAGIPRSTRVEAA